MGYPEFPVEALISQQRLSSTDSRLPKLSMDLPTEPSSSPPAHSVDSRFNCPDFTSSSPFYSSSDGYPPQKWKKSPIEGKDGYVIGQKHISKDPCIKGQTVRSKASRANACCDYMVGYTADCAAVCCCPLALLHLVVLFCIKLPTAVVQRRVKSLKRRFARKRPATLDDDCGHGSLDSSPPWSFRESPDAAAHIARVDSQMLLKHFNAEHFEFGSLSFRMD